MVIKKERRGKVALVAGSGEGDGGESESENTDEEETETPVLRSKQSESD